MLAGRAGKIFNFRRSLLTLIVFWLSTLNGGLIISAEGGQNIRRIHSLLQIVYICELI
jgi:hypothetical protein